MPERRRPESDPKNCPSLWQLSCKWGLVMKGQGLEPPRWRVLRVAGLGLCLASRHGQASAQNGGRRRARGRVVGRVGRGRVSCRSESSQENHDVYIHTCTVHHPGPTRQRPIHAVAARVAEWFPRRIAQPAAVGTGKRAACSGGDNFFGDHECQRTACGLGRAICDVVEKPGRATGVVAAPVALIAFLGLHLITAEFDVARSERGWNPKVRSRTGRAF